jgi:hypothetical protein
MGIQKLKVEKKKQLLPKHLPALSETKLLSKADESFYQQYSTKN